MNQNLNERGADLVSYCPVNGLRFRLRGKTFPDFLDCRENRDSCHKTVIDVTEAAAVCRYREYRQ
jgi:hypothetical protein